MLVSAMPTAVSLFADNPEESVHNVLTPLHRFNPALGIRSGSYWSSKGSYNAASSEWLLVGLAHPVCLVSAVGVWPFLAFFQRVRPGFCTYGALHERIGMQG
jgi:hypothetical protein